MGIRIRKLGDDSQEPEEFDDSTARIIIGRDATACQVVFPPEETQVGAQHCTLTRVFREYRLSYSSRYVVSVNGDSARDGQTIEHGDRIQLGPSGPIVSVEFVHLGNLPATDFQERPRRGFWQRLFGRR